MRILPFMKPKKGVTLAGVDYDDSGGGPLPIATSEILGGVKIGSGVNVDSEGVISVPTPTAPLFDFTTTEKLYCKLNGENIYCRYCPDIGNYSSSYGWKDLDSDLNNVYFYGYGWIEAQYGKATIDNVYFMVDSGKNKVKVYADGNNCPFQLNAGKVSIIVFYKKTS